MFIFKMPFACSNSPGAWPIIIITIIIIIVICIIIITISIVMIIIITIIIVVIIIVVIMMIIMIATGTFLANVRTHCVNPPPPGALAPQNRFDYIKLVQMSLFNVC